MRALSTYLAIVRQLLQEVLAEPERLQFFAKQPT